MIINEVPESIPRSAVVLVLKELGIDPAWCVSLELKQSGIYAEMFVKDERGNKTILLDEVATHKVFIPFT